MNKDITIGELSKLMDVSINQIRYFERKDVLKPKYVTQSGYRMYGMDEVDILSKILLLRKMDISVSDIYKMFNSNDDDFKINLLKDTSASLSLKIESLTNMLRTAETLINSAQSQHTYMDKFIIKDYPERTLYSLKYNKSEVDFSSREMFELFNELGKKNVPPPESNFISLEDEDSYYFCLETETSFSEKLVLPAGKYFTLSIVIHDELLDDRIASFRRHAEEIGLLLEYPIITISDSMLSILKNNSNCTEIQMKISEKK